MSNKRRKKYVPLRSFPWSDNTSKSDSEKLIESTVIEWYDAKHSKPSRDEIDFINSIQLKGCPFCQSDNFIKYGFTASGIQKYRCNNCGRRFNSLTDTIFDSKKIPISEWIEFLLHLFEFHSIQSTSFDNRNSATTGKYWLIKVFEVLKDIQDDVVLEGEVYIDETYFSKSKRKLVTKDGKKLRGISRNKIGIGVACDKDQSVFIVTNTSKPSSVSTMRTYGSHIAPGSTLIHDEEKSHSILINELNLENKMYASTQIKCLDGKDNPLYPVNHLHMLLKTFMRAHGGYDRDNLQDWMNLFWFIMNGPKDKYEKVRLFIELAISSPKRVKFRDAMGKKTSK